MDGDDHRGERFRSYLVGGVIGASAVIAAARRRRRRARKVAPHSAGLAAFEDAPCYQETLDREAATARGTREPGRR